MKATKINEIINIIEKNRISSTEVADALGKKGVLTDINAMKTGRFAVGKVEYVYGFDESNWPIHEQIKDIEENTILYVDSFNCGKKALFGDLVTKYLILYKRVKGIIVNGYLRDVHNLMKNDYPIWYKGATPLGCFNKEVTPSKELMEKIDERRKKFKNSIIVCDDSGCTLISKDFLDNKLKHKLELIEVQEDIWYYCLDTLKWNTYEIVCLKKYLNSKNILPKILKDKLEDLQREINK